MSLQAVVVLQIVTACLVLVVVVVIVVNCVHVDDPVVRSVSTGRSTGTTASASTTTASASTTTASSSSASSQFSFFEFTIVISVIDTFASCTH